MRRSVLAIFALGLCLGLAGCGGVLPKAAASPAPAVSSTVAEEPEVSSQSKSRSIAQSEKKDAPAQNTKRVGTDEFGYVSVPEDWVSFVEATGGTDWQYSDPTGTSIITLNTFSTEGLTEEEKKAVSPETAAQSVWFNIENGGGTSAIEGAKVEFAGFEAYQVYAAYEDGTFLVTWCFEPGDGQIHYAAAEGTGDGVSEVVSILESTWAMSE